MIESIRKMWKIGELRKKILYTAFIILIFRITIPCTFYKPGNLKAIIRIEINVIIAYPFPLNCFIYRSLFLSVYQMICSLSRNSHNIFFIITVK